MEKILCKRSISRWAAVLLCVYIIAFVLTGCSSQTAVTKQNSKSQDDNGSATRIITDMAGRKVEIPKTINTVYCAVPTAEPVVYTLAPDKLAAWVNPPSADMKNYFTDRANNLPVLGGWMGEKCTANLEEIAKLAPDVIIFMTITGVDNSPQQTADSITQQTKRPVIVMESRFAYTAKVYRLMGDILGVPDRAEKLASYCDKKIDQISGMVAKIPEDKRVGVYYAEGTGGMSTDPVGSSHTEVMDFVKAKNIADVQAKGGQGMSTVSMEQVLSWNPDVILVSSTSNGIKNYQSILSDSSWNKINAVKNNKVYLTPLLPFGWFDRPPNIMRIVGIQWLGSVLYPEYVNINLNQEVKDFFTLFYNINLTDQQVTQLLKYAV